MLTWGLLRMNFSLAMACSLKGRVLWRSGRLGVAEELQRSDRIPLSEWLGRGFETEGRSRNRTSWPSGQNRRRLVHHRVPLFQPLFRVWHANRRGRLRRILRELRPR